MAISFVSGSGTSYASRSSTVVTAPAGIADDDFLLACCLTGAGSEAPNPSPPAGFTEIGSAIDITAFGFNLEMRVYRKVAASESGNYTFTHSTTPTQAWIGAFRGVDTTTPEDATSTANSGTDSTTTWTGLTTATDAAWIVAFGDDFGDFTNNLSPPGGMTERYDVAPLLYVATEEIATAGATGNRSHTNNNNSGFGAPWGARLVALRPAAGGAALDIDAEAGSYAVTGGAAGTLLGREVAADAGSYAITGSDAALERAVEVQAEAGAYALTGTDAGVAVTARVVGADTAAYALTGTAADVTVARALDAEAGAHTVTGSAAGLAAGLSVSAEAGDYTVTGVAAALGMARGLEAGAGAYSLTGTDAALTYLTASVLAADAGTYTLSGADAGLLLARIVDAETAAVTVTGADVGLEIARTVSAEAGSFAVTGTDAALTLTGALSLAAEAGTFTIAGSDAGLLLTRIVDADASSYAVIGQDAGLTILTGYTIAAEAGAYAVTGAEAGLALARTLDAEPGTIVVTGADATLAYSAAPPPQVRVTVTGGARGIHGMTGDARGVHAQTGQPRGIVEIMAATFTLPASDPYYHGEALPIRVQATDLNGDPKTAGTLTLRISLSRGGQEVISIAGVHEGAGAWYFDVDPEDLALLPEGGLAYVNIWDDVPQVQAAGTFAVNSSIEAAS